MTKFQRLVNNAIKSTHAKRSDLKSWQWADDNIDYSLVPNYDTPYLSKFDSSRMPFWREVLESMRDPSVREVAVLKCSRAGYSENVILTDLRFSICEDPALSFYISAAEDLTNGFFEKRVIRGMGLNKKLKMQFKRAKYKGVDIHFPDMDFRATWAANKTATKQDGYRTIYVDEIDLFPEGTIDAIRRRCSAYAMHHILWGGSIDFNRKGNPEEAPILKLYAESDKRIWIMPDPAGGEFEWHLDGIKWDPDCKKGDEWDLEAVAQSAWYETPKGTRIEEADRMEFTRSGRWHATGKGIRRGYKVVAPMVPFADCSFGELAKKFLSAKYRLNQTAKRADRQRNTIRTYKAEYWASAHRDEEQITTESALEHCEEDYEIGKPKHPPGYTCGNYVTVDVQKTHLWYVVRSWAINHETGDVKSALVTYGNVASFEDLDETIGQYEPALVGIDIGYALRQSEVADYCAQYTADDPRESRVIALRGSDTLKATSLTWTIRDALEGRTSGGSVNPFLELTWSPDVFRTWLADAISDGDNWLLPSKWQSERQKAQYVKQVTSTKKVDGEWVVAGHGQEHLWDCEAMQQVLARHDGLI